MNEFTEPFYFRKDATEDEDLIEQPTQEMSIVSCSSSDSVSSRENDGEQGDANIGKEVNIRANPY